MSTNAYEEMLEYLDGQRKKLADMRERFDEPGVERQYEACLKAYRDIKNSLDSAKQEGKKVGCPVRCSEKQMLKSPIELLI